MGLGTILAGVVVFIVLWPDLYYYLYLRNILSNLLRTYPGPPLAKISDYIYTNARITKSHVYSLTIQANGVNSIFNAVDRQSHPSKPRLTSRALAKISMRRFEPIMTKQIDVFLKTLYESYVTSQPVNMTDSCKRLGLDIAGHLAFGFSLNTQTDPKYRFFIDAIATGNYRVNCFMQFPFLKSWLPDLILHGLYRPLRLRYLRTLNKIINTRMNLENDTEDLYSAVADYIIADYINAGVSDIIQLRELRSKAAFLFPAGGETVATALAALFFYLSRNPEAYRQLSDEIRNTFIDGADIKGGPKLASCRYLRACIDEALRMSPPVPGTLWRELAADKGREWLQIDGHRIPPGIQVGVNIYSLHHNEDYFPEPFVFRPERWLVEDDDELKAMCSAFAAFSTGTRGCAGKDMAYLECSLVAAKTLWYFDFETAPRSWTSGWTFGKSDKRGHPEEFQLRDVFSAAHDGPKLVFKPRGDNCRIFSDMTRGLG